MSEKVTVSLLDYGAGNVRSVRNAILANGYQIEDITHPSQIDDAKVIIFPGVGSFQSAMTVLEDKGYLEPLRRYLKGGDRPYLGICLGMQTLFDSSEEGSSNGDPPMAGLGIIPGAVTKFDSTNQTVPHIGWNGRTPHQNSPVFKYVKDEDDVYFVHSYHAPIVEGGNEDWILTSTTYGDTRYISAVQKGAIVACQFHPEKSGQTGLNFIKGFLEAVDNKTITNTSPLTPDLTIQTQLVKRVVVALDVRENDSGDLVVTKGDQYDVRETTTTETPPSPTDTETTEGGVKRTATGTPKKTIRSSPKPRKTRIPRLPLLHRRRRRNRVPQHNLLPPGRHRRHAHAPRAHRSIPQHFCAVNGRGGDTGLYRSGEWQGMGCVGGGIEVF